MRASRPDRTITAEPRAPRGAIQRALRITTERLAIELVRPMRREPAWSQFEWRIARAAAAMHGISPLLATRLSWRGPQEWQSFLSSQRAHTKRRQRRMEELLRSIDARAKHEALCLVALKGAALHALGLYEAGDRPMADLDLLVAGNDIARASRLLERLGFRQTHSYWRHRSFSPAAPRTHAELGEHGSNYIKIELHENLCERLPIQEANVSALVLAGDLHPGLNPYPSAAALLAHLLLHTAGSIVSRSVRLLQLHDIALLTGRMTEQDWSEVRETSSQSQSPWWWALPPLLLTARYYPAIARLDILDSLVPYCPRHLRRIMEGRALSDAPTGATA